MTSNTVWLTGAAILGPLAFIASALWCGYKGESASDASLFVFLFTCCGVFWVIAVPILAVVLLGGLLLAVGRWLREGSK